MGGQSQAGKLEKMTITPCKVDDEGNITAQADSKSMKVMINPSSFTHNLTISYSQKEALGANGEDLKFKNIKPDTVSFELVFDGTGVVPNATDTVKDQVDQLKKIVYQYDGKEHQPTPVRLTWGSFLFFGRLDSLNLEYTLFKPSGDPFMSEDKALIQ